MHAGMILAIHNVSNKALFGSGFTIFLLGFIVGFWIAVHMSHWRNRGSRS